MNKKYVVGTLVCILVGALLAITQAPLWAGIVAIAFLCCTLLPWMMLYDRE